MLPFALHGVSKGIGTHPILKADGPCLCSARLPSPQRTFDATGTIHNYTQHAYHAYHYHYTHTVPAPSMEQEPSIASDVVLSPIQHPENRDISIPYNP